MRATPITTYSLFCDGEYVTNEQMNENTGVYQTPKGYYVNNEDVNAFDKTFPEKGKLKLHGQIF